MFSYSAICIVLCSVFVVHFLLVLIRMTSNASYGVLCGALHNMQRGVLCGVLCLVQGVKWNALLCVVQCAM